MKRECLKPVFIDATTIGDAWYQCLHSLIRQHAEEYKIDGGSYQGQKRRGFDYIMVHIKNPGVRPLAPAIPEHLSIPAPTSEEYIEQDYVPYLMTGAKQLGEEYTYGERLNDPKISVDGKEVSFGVSPIEKVIEMYKKGHGTNQATMEVGQPSDITLSDPPCLRLVDTRIRNDKLHFMVYFRSWDLWGGFPSNLGGLQIMKEYMASEIGVGDGEIIAASKGLHLYDHAWEAAEVLTNSKRQNEF